MRYLVALLLLITPALAADWGHYVNERFGASIDVPPGFVNDVDPPENGDGLTFHDPARQAELLVWGGELAAWTFGEDAAQSKTSERERGFDISYETDHKGWYAYSGQGKGRIVYAKALESCKGTQAVYFRLEYPEQLKAEFDPVVKRLARSLAAEKSAGCPEG